MADRYTYNGACMAETPWKSPRRWEPEPHEERQLRDGRLVAIAPASRAVAFQCDPETVAGTERRQPGCSIFSGVCPVERAVRVGGALYWVEVGDDAR